VTDYFYSEHGWLIDDISVPEIGFSDDVDSGDKNWSANGWFKNVIHITDPGKAVPFYIDFTIPSNFTDNGTDNKLVVTQLVGADGDFNPGQSSASILIVNLPDFVKVVPPSPAPPSGGGGGGGGAGASEYYSYRDGVLGFYTSSIPSGITKTISAERSDSPVDSVSIVLSSVARNAFFSIAPLYSQPDTIKQALPGVYQYFSIDVRNIEPLSIGSATIRVAVPKAWVESQGKTKEDIVVARYSNGAWSDLQTVFVSEDGSDLLFDASSPGFSVFAVRFKSEIPQRPVLKPAATRKPKLAQMKPVTVVVGNESAEKVLASIKGQLQGKTDATKEEMARVFGPEPESPSKIAWKLILEISVAAFVFILIVVFVFVRRFRHRSQKVEEKEVK
jgi:PGF-pre-PGF domain-containing protein